MQHKRRHRERLGKNVYDSRQRQLHKFVRFRSNIIENIRQTCVSFFASLGLNVLVSKLPFRTGCALDWRRTIEEGVKNNVSCVNSKNDGTESLINPILDMSDEEAACRMASILSSFHDETMEGEIVWLHNRCSIIGGVAIEFLEGGESVMHVMFLNMKFDHTCADCSRMTQTVDSASKICQCKSTNQQNVEEVTLILTTLGMATSLADNPYNCTLMRPPSVTVWIKDTHSMPFDVCLLLNKWMKEHMHYHMMNEEEVPAAFTHIDSGMYDTWASVVSRSSVFGGKKRRKGRGGKCAPILSDCSVDLNQIQHHTVESCPCKSLSRYVHRVTDYYFDSTRVDPRNAPKHAKPFPTNGPGSEIGPFSYLEIFYFVDAYSFILFCNRALGMDCDVFGPHTWTPSTLTPTATLALQFGCECIQVGDDSSLVHPTKRRHTKSVLQRLDCEFVLSPEYVSALQERYDKHIST